MLFPPCALVCYEAVISDLMSMKSWQQMCILIGHAVKQPVAHAKPHVLSFFLARTIGEAHGLTL